MRPLIGVTGRRWTGDRVHMETRYQKRAFDVHISDFSSKVALAGGLPVQLPYESTGPDLVARLDGLLVSGGQDVDPAQWGGPPVAESVETDPARDRYEISLIEDALEARIPILGICRGMQIINVALGGTLIPDLPVDVIDHQQKGIDVENETHTVRFLTGSTMFDIYGHEVSVNTLHHQAVDTLGSGLAVTGRASDGVVEAVELGSRPVVGVQWHPEWRRADSIFAWFVQAASVRHRIEGGVV